MVDETKIVPETPPPQLVAPTERRLRHSYNTALLPLRKRIDLFGRNHWQGIAGALGINGLILLFLMANATFRIPLAIFNNASPLEPVNITILTEAQLRDELNQEVETPVEDLPEEVEPKEIDPEPLPEPEPEPLPEPEPEPEVIIEEVPEIIVEDVAPEIPDLAKSETEEIGVEQPEQAASAPAVEPEPSPVFTLDDQIDLIAGDAPEIVPEEAQDAAQPEPEDDPYAGLTGEEIDALYEQQNSIPEINLPEGASGADSGVVAIFCPEEFDNSDKAAECAGRTQILSGWKPGQNDWSNVTDALKRGGVDAPGGRPNYGPNNSRSLKDGETYYTRNRDAEFVLGKEEAARREAQAEIRGLTDEQRAINTRQGGIDDVNGNLGLGPNPVPAQNPWEPSWTLREDSELTETEIKKLQREADKAREKAARDAAEEPKE